MRFECFGAHFQLPPWILVRTRNGLGFVFLMMARSFDENFMTIGQTVFKILRFSFFGTCFPRPSWILVRTGSGLFFWFLMMAWSYDENFMTIGQTVSESDVLRFECFGAHFRQLSWIFRQTGSRLFFLVANDATKLRWKFHSDRWNGLQDIAIFVFGTCFRRPSWILVRTGSGLFFSGF